MTSLSPWAILATFAEEIAPVAQGALESVAAVSNAVVKADVKVAEAEASSKYLPPAQQL